MPEILGRDEFVSTFGGLFEHARWVAREVWDRGLDETLDRMALLAAFASVIRNADPDRQMALLRAHPQLAAAVDDHLTRESRNEQRAAGLDRCSADELAEFNDLNRRYRVRFGFPFIMAVGGQGRGDILRQFRARIENDSSEEFATAIEEVIKIGGFRLDTILGS